jgi:hypothetical protein
MPAAVHDVVTICGPVDRSVRFFTAEGVSSVANVIPNE